jgi:hypothetical protein
MKNKKIPNIKFWPDPFTCDCPSGTMVCPAKEDFYKVGFNFAFTLIKDKISKNTTKKEIMRILSEVEKYAK